MEYRFLGDSGLKVSALSFGAWVTFGPQMNEDKAAEQIAILKKDKGELCVDKTAEAAAKTPRAKKKR